MPRIIKVCCDQAECIIGNYWQCKVHTNDPGPKEVSDEVWYTWNTDHLDAEQISKEMVRIAYWSSKDLEYVLRTRAVPGIRIWKVLTPPKFVEYKNKNESRITYSEPPEIEEIKSAP